MQLQQGGLFRGCSHSLMFGLPYLLGPLVAPTTVALGAKRAAGPFTPRNEHVVTLHEPWHRYVPVYGQLARRDLHPLDCGLAGRYLNPKP